MAHSTRYSIARQLHHLGLQPGAPLMVHASLRRVGPIEGGAGALLDALLEVLGAKGTLVMALGAEQGVPFDAATTRVEQDMGVLAERFRVRPGVRVNDHAAARFGAIGPDSQQILKPVPLHDYHGPGSVLERFTALGGRVLRLGADTDTVTLTHLAEYRAELPIKRRVRVRYLRADSGEQWIESLDDCQGIVDWQGGDYFSQILLDFLATGEVTTGPVGNCTAELFDAATFVDFATAWMQRHLAEPGA